MFWTFKLSFNVDIWAIVGHLFQKLGKIFMNFLFTLLKLESKVNFFKCWNYFFAKNHFSHDWLSNVNINPNIFGSKTFSRKINARMTNTKNITTFSITTFSITDIVVTLSIMTLSIK
jgi:hypothetical protein